MNTIRKAIIPAAGYGTRLLPATKATPKEMLPIVDKPAIQYVVEEAIDSGIEEILIISGHAKRAIEDYFDTTPGLEIYLKEQGKNKLLEQVQAISNINIYYIKQKHTLGLGDAILCAKSFIGHEPFAILLGDDMVYNPINPALKQIMGIFNEVQTTVLGCQKVPRENVNDFGIIVGQQTPKQNLLRVIDMVEKPSVAETPSDIAALGRYIVTPEIFDILKYIEPGRNGEIQLTDALNILAKSNKMYAYLFEGKRYGIGNKMGYLQATVEYALRRDDLGAEFKQYLKKIINN